MRVRDLIADTVWTPGRDYGRKPALSVLMPAFRRARDGMFLKAARSVLKQSMSDLELILIDDASTDGTADQIRELMKEDGRVSVLTHPRNVGLPAVSEYEGFLKARGERIGFGFDDFVFQRDAFERLLEFATANTDAVVHGSISWTDSTGEDRVLGQKVRGYDHLLLDNMIGNAAVVLDREVIETVGLYDPHVAMSRVCDFDLWRRIQRKRLWREAPVVVGHEHGASRDDSLGATHPLHFEVVQEFMNEERDHLLTPAAFENRDIWSFDPAVSAPLRMHVAESQSFYTKKFWAEGTKPAPLESEDSVARRPVIGVFGHRDASAALCFDGLPPELRPQVTFIGSGFSAVEQLLMMRCDAVVFVRHLFRHPWNSATDFCRLMGIEHYWLTDDNFFLLAEEIEELKGYADKKAVRQHLKSFSGVLASSPTLIRYLRKEKMHARVEPFTAILDRVQAAKLDGLAKSRRRKGKTLRVAAFGGDFRRRQLVEAVIPALDRLGVPVELFVRGEAEKYEGVKTKNVRFVSGGLTDSFGDFLTKWRAFDLDVAVHPGGATANADYKTANALLTSRYLGAVPVVTDETAYEGLDESHGLVRSDGSEDGWYRALSRLLDSEARGALLENLVAYCERRFDPAENVATLQALLERSRRSTLFDLDHRRRTVMLRGGGINEKADEKAREHIATAAWHEGAKAAWSELFPQIAELQGQVAQLRDAEAAEPARLESFREEAAQAGWRMGAQAAYEEMAPQLDAARAEAVEALEIGRHEGRVAAYAELTDRFERSQQTLQRALREERARAAAEIALARAEAAAEALRAAGGADPFGEAAGSA